MTSDENRVPGPRRFETWLRDAKLPIPTLSFFLVFATALWLIAIFNAYLFNVVLALVGSVPLVILLLRGAAKAEKVHRTA